MTEELETILREAFPEATEVRVTDRTGGGDHFLIEVTSPRFEGLSLLEQHRLVNDALATPFASGRIHEMRIKTRGLSGAPVSAVDVLPDPEIRQELSALSGWPTIPQVFIRGELVGGADIVQELAETGELERKLSDSLGESYRDDAVERVVSVLVPA